MSADKPLTFLATVEKVQTMTDGAIRVYLDLAETELGAMAALAAARVKGVVLKIEATEYGENEHGNGRKLHI